MTSREFSTRLERRIARADLLAPGPGAIAQFEAYYNLLSRWNARINLTSLPLADAPAATLDRLFIEPLAASRHLPETPLTWVDLGTGGGSPAIPLKIVRPRASLTMVEATTKKAAFLKEVVRLLELPGAAVENLRIEALARESALKGRVHLVSARAVRMTGDLFGAVLELLEPAGRLHLYAVRSPEISSSSGFKVETVQKLGASLETKLVVLAPANRDVPRETIRSKTRPRTSGGKKR